MATFTLEAGMLTVALAVAWALRIRVNISAMGSVMLMNKFLYFYTFGIDIRRGVPRQNFFTSWPCVDPARRRAWSLRAACDGRAQTCGTRRARDRSSHSGCAGASDSRR